jgi:hypothetical protein
MMLVNNDGEGTMKTIKKKRRVNVSVNVCLWDASEGKKGDE